jgi:hypothetical protein
MPLLAYVRTDNPPLVDAVFAEAGGFTHLQWVGQAEAGDARIQYRAAERLPDLGVAADGYEVLVWGEGRPGAGLDFESRWHELITTALTSSAVSAVARYLTK